MPTITGGIITTDFGNNDDGKSVILQADGKLVVGGSGNLDFSLARYNNDGSLDTSFDGDGKVTTDFGSIPAFANAVIIQSDGKLVVAGESVNSQGGNNLILVRYNSDGSLDTSFDGDGKVISDINTTHIASQIILQADGKFVVAACNWNYWGESDFILVRYNSDGSLDTRFGDGGKVLTRTGFYYDRVSSVAVQPDGKFVLVGSKGDVTVMRYNSDGSLDTSFDSDGKVITDFTVDSTYGTTNDFANSVIVQADGKVVIAGSNDFTVGASRQQFALARYNPDGTLDSQFDGDGKLTTDFNQRNTNTVNAILVQPDGKLVVAGISTDTNYKSAFALVRYNVDGSLDASFGDHGKVTTITNSFSGGVNAIIMQPDGKLVAVGSGVDSTGKTSGDVAIIRYNSDGSLDTSFNANNIFTGTANSDSLIGTTWNNDQVIGLAGNDTLSGLAGNDTLEGGAGTDTAVYSGVRTNFVVKRVTIGFTFTVTDKVGSEGIDTLIGIEKIQFSDNIQMRLDVSGTPGQAYRIYQAAFDRKPDLSGLGFWIDAMDKRTSLQTVANGFVNSSEFQTMYGLNPSPDTFLSKLYNNVLHRAYDQSGFDFWLSTLNSGANSQVAVLAQFSESPENQDNILGLIGNGIDYVPYFPPSIL
jgi:uncharacterized delta-60 repeat protein